MNEQQMRKEFEEWFCNEHLFGGGVVNYGCSTTYIAWSAWQASRQTMKPIKLPKKEAHHVYDSHYDDGFADGYNESIKDCINQITSAGYKVE